MYLIKTVIIVVGLIGIIDGVFHKYHLWKSIENTLVRIAQKTNIRMLFELAFCMFCQRFWISTALTLAVAIYTGYNLETIIVPFIASGIYSIKK